MIATLQYFPVELSTPAEAIAALAPREGDDPVQFGHRMVVAIGWLQSYYGKTIEGLPVDEREACVDAIDEALSGTVGNLADALPELSDPEEWPEPTTTEELVAAQQGILVRFVHEVRASLEQAQ